MKVTDYIINHLSDIGIKEIFVVYGHANGDLVDAFPSNTTMLKRIFNHAEI